MSTHEGVQAPEAIESEWVTFPGGELEGRPPKVMCPSCRERLRAAARRDQAPVPSPESRVANSDSRAPSPESRAPICFQCYRVDQARERAMRAARNLHTASEARFQTTLPFEPVNRPRLDRLRAERSAARAELKSGSGRFVDKRRQAQIAARHALDRIAAGLQSRGVLISAAELQLPEAWIPFVVSR